ncbi:3-carboxy-cis,cis-muconate cycloisomerase [Nonomuraea terrae]|nr:3-carboxy-cis,cis-muconate cycloisomerase [Nonomuraea terrae]
MTSADQGPPPDPASTAGPGGAVADLGLLSPMRGAAEATGDAAVLQAMLDAEAALTRAQAALGLAPAEAAVAVTAAARAAAFDLPGLVERARSGGNPVIPLVEDLRQAATPHGAYVHRGATSQDIVDTALMLIARRALGLVLADLDQVVDRLAALAAEHRDTPMAARTLTQQAVSTTFGLKAAGWHELATAARTRLTSARQALPAQLGGAAGTLAAFGEKGVDTALRLPGAFAAELGLAEPRLPWHVVRTPVADLAGALAFTAGALGKLAADVLVLSRTEIGELSEGVGGGSSSMPHKHNPVRATMIAAAARQVPSLAAILYGSLTAEDERPSGAWHAEWQPLREALRLVAGAARDAAELVTGLRVHPGRMRANLTVPEDPGPAPALVDRALTAETPGRAQGDRALTDEIPGRASVEPGMDNEAQP